MTKKNLLSLALLASFSTMTAGSWWHSFLPFTLIESQETTFQRYITNIKEALSVYAGFTVGGLAAERFILSKNDNNVLLNRLPYQATGAFAGYVLANISIKTDGDKVFQFAWNHGSVILGAAFFTSKIGIPTYLRAKKGYKYCKTTVVPETAKALTATMYETKNGTSSLSLEFLRQSQDRSLVLQAAANVLAKNFTKSYVCSCSFLLDVFPK